MGFRQHIDEIANDRIMSKKDITTEQRVFDALIDVIGVEIEQA